ncbi:MAG: hypothetical protein DWI21_14415 [Planctomycetota bacterium]|nr:MAG: hypothetical protein DWI21_14415 [Planctomycetota bacterium]GDY07562.1 hypothetical protein LBMAG52_10480 [Planctomycetia bacterium]
MMMSQFQTTLTVLLLLGSTGRFADHACSAEPAAPVPPAKKLAAPATSAEALSATTFAQFQKQIKPQPGESRWLEVPWLLDLHAARQKAAAEGKPLFVYSSGGATGIGAC